MRSVGGGLLRDMKEDRARRAGVRRLYQKLDVTEEWVENNYYHLPIEKQVGDLVTVNGFWKDYAAHAGPGPFLSVNVAEAARSFTEMLLALAVLDLPFKPAEHKLSPADGRTILTPASPAIVFHREIREATAADKQPAILVGENFFAKNDRYRYERNEQFDKFVRSAPAAWAATIARWSIPAARARGRGLARDRRIGDADPRVGQHQRPVVMIAERPRAT